MIRQAAAAALMIGAVHAQEIRGRVLLAAEQSGAQKGGRGVEAVVYTLRMDDREFANNVRTVEEYASDSDRQATLAVAPNATDFQKRVACVSRLMAWQQAYLSLFSWARSHGKQYQIWVTVTDKKGDFTIFVPRMAPISYWRVERRDSMKVGGGGNLELP